MTVLTCMPGPEKYAHFQVVWSPLAVFSCSGDSKQDKCHLGKSLYLCTGRVHKQSLVLVRLGGGGGSFMYGDWDALASKDTPELRLNEYEAIFNRPEQ